MSLLPFNFATINVPKSVWSVACTYPGIKLESFALETSTRSISVAEPPTKLPSATPPIYINLNGLHLFHWPVRLFIIRLRYFFVRYSPIIRIVKCKTWISNRVCFSKCVV